MRRRGVPLFAVLGTAVVLLLVVATGAVGLSMYWSSSKSLDRLWSSLARQIVDRTVEHTLRHLEPARSFCGQSRALQAAGDLDVDDDAAMFRYLEGALDSYPTIMWVSYGGADGRYISVYHWEEGGEWEVRRTVRRPIFDPATGAQTATRYIEDVRGPDGTWRRARDEPGRPHDPRPKSWYVAAVNGPPDGRHWTGPRFMHSKGQLGLYHSTPALRPSGERAGVWVAEFEGRPLSDFIASLDVGADTRTFILDPRGVVTAHPDGHHSIGEGDRRRLLRAEEDSDPMLVGAWERMQAGGHVAGEPFLFGDNIGLTREFPKDTGLPWTVLVVVPRDAVFGEIEEQGRLGLLIALGALLVFVLVGVVAMRRVSELAEGLTEGLRRLSRLEIQEAPLMPGQSLVREVNSLAEAAATLKSGLQSFARYAPREIVRRVLRAGGEATLAAEPIEVSVLFTDIEGFTTIVEDTDADVVVDALQAYLGEMDGVINESGGVRLAYLGDGLLALWGAPGESADHAQHACRAVLAMRRRSEALVEQAAADGSTRPPLPTRFGLNSGVALVGNIGAPERFSYTCVGDTVNTAARLESLNKQYGTKVMIGERTAELIGDSMVLRPLDRVRAKGKVKPVVVYELVGEAGEVPDDVLRAIDLYAQALKPYFAARFEDALDGFEAALEAFGGGDPATEVMIARSWEFLASRPPKGWDGVFIAQSK